MLTAIRKSLAFIGDRLGHVFSMQDIPAEDPATYDMICQADTVGVFQIESRAQMSMLPRLKPRCFYDLVIEVAIVRPGPIQGGMVHPYLRRREGKEPVTLPERGAAHRARPNAGRAGVPGAGDAGRDPRRRLHAGRGRPAAPRDGRVAPQGRARAVPRQDRRRHDERAATSAAFAEAIFEQIKGFGEYGFPESHAASFALLVYASCWIKCHHPAEFLAAMINSQPLGFYTPSQLVQDAQAARRRGAARST